MVTDMRDAGVLWSELLTDDVPLHPAHLDPMTSEVADGLRARLIAKRAKEGDKPTAAGTRLRISNAYACSRRIGFEAAHIARDVEIDGTTLITFAVGDFIHGLVQDYLVAERSATVEMKVDYSPRVSLSGSADGMYRDQGGNAIVVEIKSMRSAAFAYATGRRKSSTPPGPKMPHLLQAGLYAMAPGVKARAVHIVYVCKDDSQTAEWLIELHEPMDYFGGATLASLVEVELTRFQGILGRIDADELPARWTPDRGRIEAPTSARSSRSHPLCGYCPWLASCQKLPSGPQPMRFLNTPPPDFTG